MSFKPFVDSMYWFPVDKVDRTALKKHFELELCVKGDWLAEPQEAVLEVFSSKRIKGVDCVGFPRGRPDLVRKCLVDRKLWKKTKDRRNDESAKIPLKMIGQYRPYQKKAIKEMAGHVTGILSAPPRMGKTVMATGLVVAKQRKTLVLAHQTDLLEQFVNQTINNDELFDGSKQKKQIAGICREYKDFKKYPLCLATYQTFLSKKGGRLLDRISGMFGMVFVDENHRVPAARYTEILSKFTAKHLHGCTATPDRKDNLYLVADRILGPIRHEIRRQDVMSPKVYGHETGIRLPSRIPKTWNGMMSMLYRNKHRNLKIAQFAKADVEKGHHVLIPVNRNDWALALKKLIDDEVGRKVCFLFNGSIPKNKRQEARDTMRFNDDVKVTIATRSMLLGMDCPDWSAVYTVAPISNAPTYTQEIHRICTPQPGKKRPVIRYFADSPLGLSYGCMVNCSKVLTNPVNGFELKPSYVKMLSRIRGGKAYTDMDIDYSQSETDPDADSVHAPAHGRKELAGFARF